MARILHRGVGIQKSPTHAGAGTKKTSITVPLKSTPSPCDDDDSIIQVNFRITGKIRQRIDSRDVTELLILDNDEVKYVPYRKVLSPDEENGNYKTLTTAG